LGTCNTKVYNCYSHNSHKYNRFAFAIIH
jgi:hypothetical protein